MKPGSVRRRPWFVLLTTCIAVGALVFVACDDDSGTTTTQTPDGSVTFDGSTTQPDPSTTDGAVIVDAGPDGEDITDGGGLPPEDDAGLTDPDGGYDAGPSCALLTPGAFQQTSCSSRLPFLSGGVLTTANYQLANVVVLGSKTFCDPDGGTYTPYEHRGALEVTATSPTAATFEFLDQYRKVGGIVVRPTTVRYDVAVSASAATLTYTPEACAAKPAPGTAGYSVGTNASGKKTLTLRLPYGSGTALFRYVEL